ncbi:MAG TPA: 6-phosphogluconolactonase [Ktedonobacteraceae bacterium]|nr:6-phosphogluconolactonase [Ktedonobacteraceae bacterium]
MRVAIYPDLATISREAASYVVRVAQEASSARGIFSIALSGGSTPGPLYGLLASEPYRSQIAWDTVHIFWGDERCVPPDDPQSNYHLAQETLLSKLNLRPEQIHRMPADRPDREQAADDYAAEVRRVLGGTGIPVFDLLQQGMGPEGHTASLFPHQPALHEQTRLIMPVSVPKPPPDRLTITPHLLHAARHILFLVTGADKADALQAVLEGPDNPDEYPTQGIVRQAQGEVVWMVDTTIAQKLSR